MADLPNNQSYGGTTTPSIPQLKVPTPPPGVQRVIDEMGQDPASGTGQMNIGNYFRNLGITPGGHTGGGFSIGGLDERARPPLATPLGSAFLGEAPPQTAPVLEDYITRQQGAMEPGLTAGYGPASGGFSWPEPNLETLDFRAPAAFEGQYIIDRSNPGSLVKSGRTLTAADRQKLLGGRPSHLYDVDHIVPLWLGGSDTEDNYQILSIPEHDKKTRVQSVAQTLLYFNKISRAEAFSMALNWKDRDDTDIPSYESGQLTESVAEQIAERWKTQDTFQPGFFAGIFARTGDAKANRAIRRQARENFTESIRSGESTQNLFQNVAEQFGYTGQVKTSGTAAGTIQELVKGAATGLTAGWATYVPAEEATSFDKLVGGAGNLAGTLLGIGKITAGMRVAGNVTARGASVASRAVQGTRAARAATAAGKATQATSQAVAQTAGRMSTVTKAVSSRIKSTIGRRALVPEIAVGGIRTTIQLKNATAAAIARTGMKNIVRNATALGIYGQLGPGGLAGEIAGEEEANAIGRAVEDIVWGLASPIGGSMLGSWGGRMVRGSGQASAVPGATAHFLQEGAGAFAASFMTLMLMERDESTFADKVTNSAVMAGLHLMGVKEQRGNWKRYVDGIRKESYAMGANNLNVYVPKVKRVKDGETVTQKFTPEELASIRDEAITKVDDLYARGLIDKRTVEQERIGIGASIDALENMGLTPEQLNEKNLRTIFELRNRVEILNNRKPQQPAGIEVFTTELPEATMKSSHLRHTGEPSGEFPTGRMMLSAGSRRDFEANQVNLNDFIEYKNRGRASPTIILASEPENAPFWRAQNLSRRGDEVKDGQFIVHKRPENSIEAWGRVVEEDGTQRLMSLGFFPRRSSIADVSEGGRATSFNTKIGNKKTDKFYLDPEFNKDTVADAMSAQGLRFMTANIENANLTKGRKDPYLTYTINDANWNESIAINRQARSNPAFNNRTAVEASAELQASKNPQRKNEIKREIQQKTRQPASDVLTSDAARPLLESNAQGVRLTASILKNVEEALSAKNADDMAKILGERFGVKLSKAEADNIFQHRESQTVSKMMNMVAQKGDEATKSAMRNFISPMAESRAYKSDWTYAGSFGELRVLGGTPPVAAVTPPGAPASTPQPAARPTQPKTQELAEKATQVAKVDLPTQTKVTQARADAPATAEGATKAVPPKTADTSNKVVAAAVRAGEAPRTQKTAPVKAEGAEVPAPARGQATETPTTQNVLKVAPEARQVEAPVVEAAPGAREAAPTPRQTPQNEAGGAQVTKTKRTPSSERSASTGNKLTAAAIVSGTTQRGATTKPLAFVEIKQRAVKPAPKKYESRLRRTREENVHDSTIAAEGRLEELDRTKDLSDYITSLRTVVNTSTAYPNIAAHERGARGAMRELGPAERKALDKRVQDNARKKAIDLAENHSGIDEALTFSGIDSSLPHTQALYRANIASQLGDLDRATGTLSGITPKELRESASRMDAQSGSNLFTALITRLERHNSKKVSAQKKSTKKKETGKETEVDAEVDAIEQGWNAAINKILKQRRGGSSTRDTHDARQVEKAGDQYVKALKTNQRSGDEHAAVKSFLLEDLIKRWGITPDSPTGKKVLGSVHAPNPLSKRGRVVQDRVDAATEVMNRNAQGKELTHTKTFIQARGMGSDTAKRLLSGISKKDPKILEEVDQLGLQVSDLTENGEMDVIPFLRDVAAGRRDAAVKRASKARQEQTERHAADKERGAFSKNIDDIEDYGISNTDLSQGKMRLLSTTQDIGQTQGLSRFWTRNNPGLTAAMEAGRKPSAQEAKLDAAAEALALMRSINNTLVDGKKTTVSFGFLKGKNLRGMSEAERAKWFKYSEKKTRELVNELYPNAVRRYKNLSKKK